MQQRGSFLNVTVIESVLQHSSRRSAAEQNAGAPRHSIAIPALPWPLFPMGRSSSGTVPPASPTRNYTAFQRIPHVQLEFTDQQIEPRVSS